MEHLIISYLQQFNQLKNTKFIDYQHVSQCSVALRVKKWNTWNAFLVPGVSAVFVTTRSFYLKLTTISFFSSSR
jgi:hypothetical protein